jgi:quinol monooxygenase YgiN
VSTVARSISQKAYAVIRHANRSSDLREGTNSSMLYIATLVLQVRPSKRPEVLSAIRQVMRSMRMSPDCVVCRSLTEADDVNTLVLVSEWSTQAAFEELLKSQEFLVLRGMRMLLQKDTQLVMDEVAARTVLVLND